MNRDSIRSLLTDIIREEMPHLALAGEHTYLVHAVKADGRLDLVPLPPNGRKLPSLQDVDEWCGVPGAHGDPVAGSGAVVVFRDGKSELPIVLAFFPLKQTGGVPAKVEIDASTMIKVGASATAVEIAGGGPAVGRVGDAVQCGSFSAVGVMVGAPIQFVYTPFGSLPLPPGSAVAIIGQITSGSGKVTSG